MTELDFKSLVNKRTLILGDVNSGKTTVTQKALDDFCDSIIPERIVIIDMSPVIPPELAARKGLSGVGGGLSIDAHPDILLLKTDLAPPRLASDTEEEAEGIAEQNAHKIESLFEKFIASQRDVLFLNDLTLYLQAGSAEQLGQWLEHAETVVANGYQGKTLGQGRLSVRESQQLIEAENFFDIIIKQQVR